MLPTNPATALRRELDGYDKLKVRWEGVADGVLLALLHRCSADECRWEGLVPHLRGRHTYMTTTQGHARPQWDDFVAAFHDHGVLPDDTWHAVWQKKHLSRDYPAASAPASWSYEAPFTNGGTISGSASNPGPRLPTSHTGECDTVSSATPTGTNRCTQCYQVAARPWPEPPAGPCRRREEEALQQCIEGAQTLSHGQAVSAVAELLRIYVHLEDPTAVTHLLHVFEP